MQALSTATQQEDLVWTPTLARLAGSVSFNICTTPKINIEHENFDLEKVTPFNYGHFWYLC